MIAIIDYGSGNTGSILNMVRKIGGNAAITSSAEEIEAASGIILPGVGAFDAVAQNLEASNLLPLIEERVLQANIPFLGICVGMQILFDSSEEGNSSGLGWIPGKVERFNFAHIEGKRRLKIPHMGWNLVDAVPDNPLFRQLDKNSRFYFVHSYHAVCSDEYSIAKTSFGYPFTCAVQKGNIMGVQFHPEKSHKFGMQLLGNFVGEIC